MATKLSPANLAVRRNNTPRVEPRIALRRVKVALANVITRTPVPGHAWYDITRAEPRSALPFEKEREMLHQAIRQGCTTPELIIAYRMAQMQDDLAQFDESPLLEELLYLQMMREQHEALHAQARAHAFPSTSLDMEAVRETEESTVVQRAYCWLKREGRSLLHSH